MTFGQALGYFLREAAVSLVRSWKISLLAIFTIAMSLFMGGFFFLLTSNLSRTAVAWGEELKVVVYLERDVGDDLAAVRELSASPAWVTSVREVSSPEARRLFQTAFPSLSDLVETWEEEPFPPSLEVSLDSARIRFPAYEQWMESLRKLPQVEMVDDDRDWLKQLATLVTVAHSVGLTLGLTLLAAAIFTIASVVRLTAYLYLEEIAVMRLVGATEFFIRGPFYAEGFLQGLVGGLLALAGLYGAFHFMEGARDDSLWLPLLVSEFLDWYQSLLLVTLGGTAGLLGAVLSLRKESLKSDSQD